VSGALRALVPLEARVAEVLGAPVRLAAVGAEGDALAEAPHAMPRARDRRRGRVALGELLARLGRSDGVESLRFPHPELSLSHSGDWAIAAGCEAGGAGIGIDLEFSRPMDVRAARFYLLPHEIAHVQALPSRRRNDERLRLWTIKEAVFKACAGNAGRLLLDFGLDVPAALAGTARRVDGVAFSARYGSIDIGDGWLAIALATTGATA
jgi:hypothetical protein